MENISTISWAHCNDLFLHGAQRVWGNDVFSQFRPTDFVKLLTSLSHVQADTLNYWVYRMIKGYQFQDFTRTVVPDEDACLFSAPKNDAPVLLSILILYLQNSKTITDDWCYLDMEMKALAHFVKRNDGTWYCELYCLGAADASYLHVINDGYWDFLIPVCFMKDKEKFTLFCQSKVGKKSCVLRDYLPKDKFDFLSRRRQKATQPEQKGQSKKSYPVDRGDML